jgi:molybdate transport system ATP-binding protein
VQQRAIGMVFQDFALFPHLNVRQNVAYAAPKGKGQGAWIDQLLDLTGLYELHERAIATLSGGQKQRVALARALARKPQLLLLDEPLSALDQHMRAQLQDVLLRLHHELGLTTLMVTHDLGEVFKLANKVLCIEDGKSTDFGTPNELFLQSRHAGKLNVQAQILAIQREEIVLILSLLIGQEIIQIIADEDEIKGLNVGDQIAISTKAFSPSIMRL